MIVKVNLNDYVKFKLTDRGKDIYFHQYDDLNEYIKQKNGSKPFSQQMPEVDNYGYTKMQLWAFIELYGKHIGIAKPNVIEPLNLYFEPSDGDIDDRQAEYLLNEINRRFDEQNRMLERLIELMEK